MADGGTETSDGWTRERVELVKRTICPKGISDDEFALFMEQCKRSGLDPLLKEAFCVARRQNIGSREKPNWVSKHEFQPSEAGMLARAERFPDYGGIQASAVYADDEIEMDQGRGDVSHRFNPAKRKGALVGAWSKVARNGKLPVLVWLDFSGYVQQTPLWSKIPSTMIEKCARVAALRKAYPEAFGGLYVREEMPAEEFVDEQPAPAPSPAQTVKSERRQREQPATLPAKTATREAAEVAAAGLQREPVKAEVLPPEQPAQRAAKQAAPAEVATFERPPEKATLTREQVAKAESVATQLGGQVVTQGEVGFGPWKGLPIATLSDADLGAAVDMANERLLEEPGAKWAKKMEANRDLLFEEIARRGHVAHATSTRSAGGRRSAGRVGSALPEQHPDSDRAFEDVGLGYSSDVPSDSSYGVIPGDSHSDS